MFQLNKAFQFLKRKPDILLKYYISTTISLFFFSPLGNNSSRELIQRWPFPTDSFNKSIFFQRRISLIGKSYLAFCGCCREDFAGRDLPSKSWLLNVQLAIIPLFWWLLLYQWKLCTDIHIQAAFFQVVPFLTLIFPHKAGYLIIKTSVTATG